MKITIEIGNTYKIDDSIKAAIKASNGERLNGAEQILMTDIAGILEGMKANLMPPRRGGQH
jgi:hypothetical protein